MKKGYTMEEKKKLELIERVQAAARRVLELNGGKDIKFTKRSDDDEIKIKK